MFFFVFLFFLAETTYFIQSNNKSQIIINHYIILHQSVNTTSHLYNLLMLISTAITPCVGVLRAGDQFWIDERVSFPFDSILNHYDIHIKINRLEYMQLSLSYHMPVSILIVPITANSLSLLHENHMLYFTIARYSPSLILLMYCMWW